MVVLLHQSNTEDDEGTASPLLVISQKKELMQEAEGKRRRIGSIRGCRISSQRGLFRREHGGTVRLITPSAGLLKAHLDGIVEWEVLAYLGCFMCGRRNRRKLSPAGTALRDYIGSPERGTDEDLRGPCEKSGKRVIFELA